MEANILHFDRNGILAFGSKDESLSSIALAGEYRKYAIGQSPSRHSRGQSSHYVTNRKVLTRYLTAIQF